MTFTKEDYLKAAVFVEKDTVMGHSQAAMFRQAAEKCGEWLPNKQRAIDAVEAHRGELLAEVARLRARWEALKAWALNTYTDDELTTSGSEKLRTKMAELEARR